MQMELKMNSDIDQPTVGVFVGMPASGKSTARGRGPNHHQYSTDDIVEQFAADTGVNYDDVWQDYIKQATVEADVAVGAAIKEKKSVIWDQTNLTAKKRGKILAKFDNYYKTCICILPPHTQLQKSELQRRLDSRVGKQIPKFVIASMLKSFVLPTLDEGFDSIVYLDIYGHLVPAHRAESIYQEMQNK
jgi:predicted kinase